MTLTTPATLGPYVGPYLPLNNTTPFTYRDGLTNSEILASWQDWLNTAVVGFINDNFASLGDEFVTQVNLLLTEVNATVDALTNNVNTDIATEKTYVDTTIATEKAYVDSQIATLNDFVNTSVNSIINSTIAVTDPVTLAIFNNLTSNTRIAMDAQYAPNATTYSKTQTDSADATTLASAKSYTDTSAPAVKETPLTPYRFGAVAPIAGSDNTAAITAMFAAAAGSTYTGSEIYFPPGMWYYKGTSALQLFQGMRIRGAGRNKTRLINAGTANLFEWNVNYSAINIDGIWIEGAVAGKGIFAPQASGGMYGSHINNCGLTSSVDTGFIWQQNNNSSFVHNNISNTVMERTVTSTVIPFSIITTAAAANFNKFDNVRFNGYNNISTPFMHVETTLAATYLTDWVMINILGEQNPGGILRVLGANNWTLINVTDEDSTVDYGANIIDFQASSAGVKPIGITVMNSGRRGRQMVGGFYDLSFDSGSSGIAIINCNPTPTSQSPLIKVPTSGATIIGTRGFPTIRQAPILPNTNINGMVGDIFINTAGGAATTLWVKESGTAATGWVGK